MESREPGRNAGELMRLFSTGCTITKTENPQTDSLNTVSGSAPIFYEAGRDISRFAAIIPEGIQYWVRNAVIQTATKPKARIQLTFDGLNAQELHSRCRMYLHPDTGIIRNYSGAIGSSPWLTIWELFCGAPWLGATEAFRITLEIVKQAGAGQPLWFAVSGSRWNGNGWSDVWGEANTDYPIQDGWITLESWYRQGDENNGRFVLKVDGATILDVTDKTYDGTPTAATHWHPLKLYTSGPLVSYVRNNSPGQAMQLYWNDVDLWTSWPVVV